MKLEIQLWQQFVPLWCWSVPILHFSELQAFTISKTVLAKKNTKYCNCRNGHWRFWQLSREQMGLLASWGNLRVSLGFEGKQTNLNAFTKRDGSWSCWRLNEFLGFPVKKQKSITMNTEFTDHIIQTKLDAYFKMLSHWNARWPREAPHTTA